MAGRDPVRAGRWPGLSRPRRAGGRGRRCATGWLPPWSKSSRNRSRSTTLYFGSSRSVAYRHHRQVQDKGKCVLDGAGLKTRVQPEERDQKSGRWDVSDSTLKKNVFYLFII